MVISEHEYRFYEDIMGLSPSTSYELNVLRSKLDP